MGSIAVFDKTFLNILVCPETGAGLIYKPELQELWCRASRLAYPIENDVPVMMVAKARLLTDEELDA